MTSTTTTDKKEDLSEMNGKMMIQKCPDLASRFRGCMLGSLVGDCLGQPFEGEDRPISKSVLNSYFEKLHDSSLKGIQFLYSGFVHFIKSILYFQFLIKHTLMIQL